MSSSHFSLSYRRTPFFLLEPNLVSWLGLCQFVPWPVLGIRGLRSDYGRLPRRSGRDRSLFLDIGTDISENKNGRSSDWLTSMEFGASLESPSVSWTPGICTGSRRVESHRHPKPTLGCNVVATTGTIIDTTDRGLRSFLSCIYLWKLNFSPLFSFVLWNGVLCPDPGWSHFDSWLVLGHRFLLRRSGSGPGITLVTGTVLLKF